jgi:3-deoxy-manno-octulosonate cytidylyltransferase (CMP-KDO synthetase)
MEHIPVDFIVIIPARLKSSRLNEKLLQTVAGKPLLYHTYQTALQSKAKKVLIATDSQKIVEVMSEYHAECILTDENHNSGTARIAEVVAKLGLKDDEIIINLQGDEPLMPPENINQLAENLAQNDVKVATLRENFTTIAEYQNPNNVKAVFDNNNNALYFSRAPIPFFRDDAINLDLCFKHIGIYGYKAAFFTLDFNCTTYEAAEKLEQLKILQSGYNIHIDSAKKPSGVGVDTIEDLEYLRGIVNDN